MNIVFAIWLRAYCKRVRANGVPLLMTAATTDGRARNNNNYIQPPPQQQQFVMICSMKVPPCQ